MNAAFNAANQYADTFEPHCEFYRQNESLDLEAVKAEEHGTFTGLKIHNRHCTIVHSSVEFHRLKNMFVDCVTERVR